MQKQHILSNYEKELQNLGATYSAALGVNVDNLKKAIAAASDLSVIGVGSGGSFTVASLLCNLHESYTGRVSRPATPLEIICNPTIASASPVFLISAEGKNPDIIEALLRARLHSARSVNVLTNRQKSPLTKIMEELTDISPHVFELAQKDGYLATNSLLMDAVLVARAYSELDSSQKRLPDHIEELTLCNQPIEEWIKEAEEFAAVVAKRGGVIVTYSPLLKSIAADLESKLAEAALVHCQLADLRSFAHGRHLWLANRQSECAVLALTEPSLANLWAHMREIIPADVPTLTMQTGGGEPPDLIAGLVAQMHFVGLVSNSLGRDPGKPDVPKFGRDLYYAKLSDYVQKPNELNSDFGERSKSETLGARWPSKPLNGAMRRELDSYKYGIENQIFKAIVFDYDGTLCASQRKNEPPPASILKHLNEMADKGIIIGIASGRGNSIQQKLSEQVPEKLKKNFKLGLYNGGWICNLDSDPEIGTTSEFLSHVTRIVWKLKNFGVPIETIKPNHPYQVSIRFREGIATEQMWFVVADALRQAGLDMSRIVCSKHSVDVLSKGVGKSRLITHIIQGFKIEPYQILTMGDQGAWPGNDSSLLEHRFSLSVDLPSRRIDRGWKFYSGPRFLDSGLRC